MGRSNNESPEFQRIASNVRSFFKRHEKFEAIKAQYEELRAEFNSDMDAYYDKFLAENRKNAKFEDTNGDELIITRVAPTKIEWFPDKLRKRVTKPIWKQLVQKHYEIKDMPGLVRYLKSCGVDPNIFKMYIEVTETVDEKAIERLGDLGKLTPHNIAGCYLVKSSKPYYRLKRKSPDEQGSEEKE